MKGGKIRRIQEIKGSKVLVYFTSARHPIGARIAKDAVLNQTLRRVAHRGIIRVFFMEDKTKTTEQLIREVSSLKQRIAELERLSPVGGKGEQASRASEDLFVQFARHIPGSVYVKDADRRIVYHTGNGEQYFEVTPDKWLGKTSEEILPPEFAAEERQHDEAVLRGETVKTTTTRPHADELRTWVNYRFPICGYDKLNYIGCISFDITESKQVKKIYESLMENSLMVVFIVQDGRFRFLNERALGVTGYLAEELVGREADVLIHPDDREMVRHRGSELLFRRDSTPIQYRLLDKQGQIKRMLQVVSPIHFDGRRAMLGNAMDVTDLWKAETENIELEERVTERTRELKESTAQLIQAEKLMALGELTASVAHELKQPLNTIKIIGQSILRDIEKKRFDEQSARDDLPEIIRQVDKMAQIIDHMRVFTRRPIEACNEIVALNGVIGNALKFVEQQMKTHNIEIVKELAADLPEVLGDSIRLEQVVINLINNARHAVEQAGKENKRIEVRTGKESDGRTVWLDVKDNGMGISEEAQKKIFQPFFTTKEPGKGTGLGLSVSKKIIEEHKGTMEFTSNLGEGAAFRFVLPMKS